MTDETHALGSDTVPPPRDMPPRDTQLRDPAAAPNRSPLLAAVAVLALLVVIGGVLLWRQGAAASSQVAQMQARIDSLDSQVSTLAARPVPPPPPDLRPLQQRLAALEARQPPDLAPLDQRLTALEQKPPPETQLDAAGQKQLAQLSGRIDGIAARQDQLGTQEQADTAKLGDQFQAGLAKLGDAARAQQQADTAKLSTQESGDVTALRTQEQADAAKLRDQEQADMAKLGDQVGALDGRIAAAVTAGSQVAAQAQKANSDLATVAGRQARGAQLQAAAVALQAGRPLGEIPGAPPALAQFAGKPPPTEAALRLSFDAAAQSAEEANQPAKESTPLLTRMWDRAQSGLTVRQGDRVIVGDVVTGVLEHARHQLDAGDLAGAVSALDGLNGPAAAAMGPWRAQAQSLLDARSALLTAAHG